MRPNTFDHISLMIKMAFFVKGPLNCLNTIIQKWLRLLVNKIIIFQ